jgi:trimeric autotransporter adhesin
MEFGNARGGRHESFRNVAAILLAAFAVVAGTGSRSAISALQAPAVANVSLSPSTIAGGSGSSATGTVTLTAPAPSGGAIVTLSSSLVELAATMPSVTVAPGATSATFVVATNPRYRAYSNLSFNATISATLGTTRGATLTVTAQPRPPDFASGSTAGANTQWDGLMCGGIAPIGGHPNILYSCAPADATGFGTCTFHQECTIGCRRVPPNRGTFNDFCAVSGPNPLEVSDNYFTSGDHVPATVRSETPVTRATTASPNVTSVGFNARDFSPDDIGGLNFPAGATTVNFTVATSYVPAIEFVDVGGFWFDDAIPPFLITSGRGGHVWAVMVPPAPPPTEPIPTPVQFKIVGLDPTTGDQGSLGQVHTSGLPYGNGPTISFTSSHPSIVPAPASVTMPEANLFGFDVPITTIAPAEDTDVTITATDGRYSFSDVLTVRADPPPPLLAGVSVNPGSVVGGTSATGTVRLSEPHSTATVVQVSIGDTAPASLPSNTPPCPPSSRCHNVTVPAGQTTANFTITTSPVTSQFNLNVFAHTPQIEGNTGRNALLLITPGGSLTIKALAIAPDSVTGGSGATGTVTLSGNAPSGGAVVALSKSLSNGGPGVVPATIPASVTVPAGQTTASFAIGTSSVTTATNVRISGTFNGATANADFTLFPLLLSVQFEGTVPGGQSGTGTVFLNSGAPAGGLVVSLTSLNTSLATVPASVTVPAGQTSVNFTANTSPVNQFTFVEIRGTAAGRTVAANLFISVSLAPTAVTFTPSSLVGPGTVTGRVTLGSASPGNSNVSLVSSNTVLATVPFSVIVSQGQTSATFPVNVGQVTSTTTVQISATFENVTRSGTLTINPSGGGGGPTLSTVALNPTSVVGGTSSTGTVTLSAAAPSGGTVVSLSENSASTTLPANVTVPSGATSANFTVTTTAVTTATTSTITATLGGVTRTASLTVNASSTPAPTAPTLSSPANAATNVPQPVLLDWNNVTNATSYEVQVDNSSTIAAPFVANPTVTTSQVNLASGLPAQQLWWRVRARNSAGVFGPFSAVRSLTPQGAATGPTATLTVTATGRSGERVTSTPAGINVSVGTTGSASFTTGTSITLRVTNSRDAVWSGACSSGGNKTKTCTFVLNGNATVNASVQ